MESSSAVRAFDCPLQINQAEIEYLGVRDEKDPSIKITFCPEIQMCRSSFWPFVPPFQLDRVARWSAGFGQFYLVGGSRRGRGMINKTFHWSQF
jgi:hypothetical protein